MVIQTAGVVAVLAGALLLWSPWALIVVGLLAVFVPELVEAVKR